MSTFTAVVVSHGNEAGIRWMLDGLGEQTRQPDEVLVYACCITPDFFPRISCSLAVTEHQGDWGHTDRARGLAAATGDYLGFFNGDDSYEPDYVETMMGTAEQVDAAVVYCDWLDGLAPFERCEFRLGRSTAGNFIVRTDLARQVGYPASRVYENDGHFIDAVAKAARRPIVHVPRFLYRHNLQR